MSIGRPPKLWLIVLRPEGSQRLGYSRWRWDSFYTRWSLSAAMNVAELAVRRLWAFRLAARRCVTAFGRRVCWTPSHRDGPKSGCSSALQASLLRRASN